MAVIDSLIPSLLTLGNIAIAFSEAPYTYLLRLPPGTPENGQTTWFAQTFSTYGVSQNGVTLQVSATNSGQVTVTVDSALAGDVVLYASYASTNGALLVATPVVIYSNPVGSVLGGIMLDPPSAALSVGDALTLDLWGQYTNKMRSLLYLTNGQARFISSNPKVATVDANGTITMVSSGSATIIGSYNGFAAQMLVSSIAPTSPTLYGAEFSTGNFSASAFGSYGTTNIIEASTNLVNWIPIGTVYNCNGSMQFQDTGWTNFPSRFYRIVVPKGGSTNAAPFAEIISFGLTNGGVELTVIGSVGVTNIIQVSSNLTSWTAAASFLNTNGIIQYIDTTAGSRAARFYRVLIP